MKKVNTQENIRGAWIKRYEIHQLRNDVSREIEYEKNPQQNELNNADVVIEVKMLTYLTISYHQRKTLLNSQMTSMRMDF